MLQKNKTNQVTPKNQRMLINFMNQKRRSLKKIYLISRDGKRAPGGQWARNKRTARACPGKFTGKMGCPGKTVIYVFSGEAVPVSTFLGNCPELPIFIKKNLVRLFSELFFFFFFRKQH